jgi:hypothetical protein
MGKQTVQVDTPGTALRRPRHVAFAIKHLLAQRDKAILVRDKAGSEVLELDAALLALGWTEPGQP